jgi:pSer/pThr/pTyr-binding forkhead associated (FHA) protein
MASIIVISGKQAGEYLPLGKRTNVIGRAEALPLQILDEMVSRRHLRISFDATDNCYSAEDMHSKHGTMINNFQIETQTILSEGDEILIGQTMLLFTEEDIENRDNALMHYKKVGEKVKPTLIQ